MDSIAEYIGRDSPAYGRIVVAKVLETVENIREFPLAGRAVPELIDSKVRERFVYSYRLVYRIENHEVLMVAVIHGKRLFEGISERFEERC